MSKYKITGIIYIHKREKERERDRDRDRDRDRQRHRERQTDRQTDRDRYILNTPINKDDN